MKLGRFKRNRAGAAYPLLPDEILQARSALADSAHDFGWLFLRVTRDAYREQAEYWFGSDRDFISTIDQLSHEVFQRVSQAVADLADAAKGCNPEINANDTGRSIIFWHGDSPVTVFVPNHPASYRPSTLCLLAFDRLWSILVEYPAPGRSPSN